VRFVIIISIAFVLLIPNIAFAQEPRPQQEESEQESPDFIIMSGLIIVMAGNFIILYAFAIMTWRVGKAKPALLMPYVHFILEDFRNDKKLQKLMIITIGLWVAGFAVLEVVN